MGLLLYTIYSINIDYWVKIITKLHVHFLNCKIATVNVNVLYTNAAVK